MVSDVRLLLWLEQELIMFTCSRGESSNLVFAYNEQHPGTIAKKKRKR